MVAFSDMYNSASFERDSAHSSLPAVWLVALPLVAANLFGCDDSSCAGRQVYPGNLVYSGDEQPAADVQRCVEVVTGDLRAERVDAEVVLPKLQHVLGDVILEDGAPSLPALRLVEGELRISEDRNDKEGMRSLPGLGDLREVNGDLRLSNLKRLKSLEGLEKLERVGGDMELSGLQALASLDALENLESTGAVVLRRDDALTDVSALDTMRFTYGLVVDGLPELEQLVLEDLFVRGPIDIVGNDALEYIQIDRRNLADEHVDPARETSRFGPCVSTRATLSIRLNPELEAVQLATDSMESLAVADNESLSSVTIDSASNGSFECVTLRNLPTLEELDLGLSLTIRGDFQISRTSLTSLDDLGRFQVGCDLTLSENPNLASFGNPSVGWSATVLENPGLSQCEVDTLEQVINPARVSVFDPGCQVGFQGVTSSGNDEAPSCS